MKKKRIFVTQVFGFIFGFIMLFSESAFEDSIISGGLFAIGLMLIGIGTVGRLWCSIYISGRKDKILVTVGPYSITRNPLYLFSLIGAAGVGFATETVTFTIIIISLFAIFYPTTIKKEETYLEELFGSEYKAYYSRVLRFFPNIKLLYEPMEIIINPVICRKRILNSLWFIWIAGFLELVEMLHEFKIIPVLLHIY